ncbi:MAG: hypothetical protein J0H44_25235 [Alphaproteobacteria bacterium]|nr:hypothetical protein [Alphaproteobacteria bacterium]
MSDPTNNFSFDLDPYDRLAQMYGVGLFDLLPLPPSWSKYVGAQYGPDPSLLSAPVSDTPGFDKSPMFTGVGTTTPGFRPLPMAQIGDTPGFHKSPAVLEAQAAADPRPPGFYRSPAFLGAGAMTPGVDPHLPPTIGPQAMLFGGPGLPPAPPLSAGPTPLPRLDLTPVSFPPPLSPPAMGTSPPGAQPPPRQPDNFAGNYLRATAGDGLPEQRNASDNEPDLNIGYTPAGLRAQGGEFARIAADAAQYGQVMARPYVNFYNNSIVKPFYTALGALANSPLGDPGFYASLQGIGPYGVPAATAGQGIAQGLRTLADLGRAAKVTELEKATVPLFRAIGQNELGSFLSEGGYAAAPSRSGKYFSFDLYGPTGAMNFAAHPFNANLGTMTMTQVNVPKSVLLNGTRFFDPGGAGASIHFEDEMLPLINQFGPRIIGQ